MPALTCPVCGAPEVNITDGGDKLFIRAYKVCDERGMWSQCLVCAGFYKKVGTSFIYNEEKGDRRKGWFL